MDESDAFLPFWEGTLPLEERQTIEEYQQEIEPLIGEVITALKSIGFDEPTRSSESYLAVWIPNPLLTESTIAECDLAGALVLGAELDVDRAVAIIDEILVPAGLLRDKNAWVGDELGAEMAGMTPQTAVMSSGASLREATPTSCLRRGRGPVMGRPRHVRTGSCPSGKRPSPRLPTVKPAPRPPRLPRRLRRLLLAIPDRIRLTT